MKLSLEQIKKISCGLVNIEEKNGCFRLNRFTDEQLKLYKEYKGGYFFNRALCSSGIRLAFNTDSTSLFITGITSYGTSRTYYAFDVFVNDKLIGCIDNFLQEFSDNYIEQNLKLGEFEKRFNLGEGTKKVEIYLPFSVIVDFEEISLDDGAFFEPINRKHKGLLFGDSITQGYDNAHVSNHYSVAVSRLLDVDFVNKAIGGEIFNPTLANLKDDFKPDYVVVAYGTNDWGTGLTFDEFFKNCKEFYCNLSKNYPDSKILAFAPIWRKESVVENWAFDFKLVGQTICNVANTLKNVTFIDCYDFIPHEEKYFVDSRLHPNDLGFKHYAKNLSSTIKDLLNL
ncbi:MAG: SGNH/GDSL hydrolase family protein [Clostridia bacterium]|nr:SGNH/GDSL hydrolase family protein [Clostridia bacterium]